MASVRGVGREMGFGELWSSHGCDYGFMGEGTVRLGIVVQLSPPLVEAEAQHLNLLRDY